MGGPGIQKNQGYHVGNEGEARQTEIRGERNAKLLNTSKREGGEMRGRCSDPVALENHELHLGGGGRPRERKCMLLFWL